VIGDRELEWLRKVRDLCHALAAERDLPRLPRQILDAAVELTGAERGFLVRVLGQKPSGGYSFEVEVARGFDHETLTGAQGKVSRTVVRRMLEERPEGIVTSRERDVSLTEVTSVLEQRVRSILCVPLRLRGKVLGVLYLDHRSDDRAFTEADLAPLRTLADQAALAWETLELRATSARSLPPPGDPARLIGASPPLRELRATLERLARSAAPVLVLGESGTGKELVARRLHALGATQGAPFVSENCAAIAETLLESELFGHVQGAFTGATGDKPGLFALAAGGTLFLDEVGDMSLAMQAKLLRALQEGEFRPVGAEGLRPIACRVIAATNHDLEALVAEGRFRADLYYRLDVLRVTVPPLRERAEDVPLLVRHFSARHGRAPLSLTPGALAALQRCPWPGNVRQLENEVARLCSRELSEVSAADLSPELRESPPAAGSDRFAGKTLRAIEREAVRSAMQACGGNKSQAARRLGISRSSLYLLLERYGIT